jgi:glycosyltransferase involved in cell wall biosynthesis
MKIVFLSFDFGEYSVRLASALAREEADVLLLLPDRLAAPHAHLLDGTVDFRPFHKPRFRQALSQLRTARWLIAQIDRFHPDIVHLQQGHPWFNLALPLLRRYPLVLTVHDPRLHLGDMEGRKVPQAIYDFGFRRASQLIVHGYPLRQPLIDELRIPSEIVHVIPHIVLGEAPSLAIEDEAPTVLFFGRIWEYKGLDYLIRAEPLISAAVPDARFVIAGKGEDFGRYRAMMAHPDRFEIHNEFVSDEERAELFARASVVVLPYVEASQSGVIPLAYSASRPVVATSVGALPEAVDHGLTGFLVPPRDEGALAEATILLLRDRELRYRMGAAGKLKIDTESSPQVVARKTLAVYRLALGGVPSRIAQGVAR